MANKEVTQGFSCSELSLLAEILAKKGQMTLVEVGVAEYKIYYITKGTKRGSCRHQHRNIYYAYHCLRHDFSAAQKEGSISDRRICAVQDGQERELYEHEVNELDQVRRVILKETTLKEDMKNND